MNLDDFFIEKELDDTHNQRVMIIYGDSLNDYNNRNGAIDIISSPKGTDYYHSTYLEKHAKTNYVTDEKYQTAINSSKKTFCHSGPVFILTNKYNNIVFTDTTIGKNNRKYGVLYFPEEEPSPEQYETLNYLINNLLINYNEILINGKIYIDEYHLLDSEISFTLTGKELINLENIIRNEYKKKCLKRVLKNKNE